MPESVKPPAGRSVKGNVLIDYIKLMRTAPNLPWSDHLSPEEMRQLDQLILPVSWYPLELFQNLGLAVFKLISKENYEIVRAFGRFLADKMNRENPGMITQGRPRDTLNKFMAIQNRLYSFKLLQTEDAGPRHILAHIDSAPDDEGDRMFVAVTSGTIERLIELSGGRDIKIKLVGAAWEGASRNTVEVTWEDT